MEKIVVQFEPIEDEPKPPLKFYKREELAKVLDMHRNTVRNTLKRIAHLLPNDYSVSCRKMIPPKVVHILFCHLGVY